MSELRREIGQKLEGSSGGLPGIGIVIMKDSRNSLGQVSRSMMLLKESVRKGVSQFANCL